MEELLLRVGSQAANFAIRSGLAYASKIAFVQVSKYIQDAPDEATPELEKMRKRLENRIKIVTPAIDLIERIAARGNTSLASTVQLTTALRHDINEFGKRVSEVTESRNTARSKTSKTTSIDNAASVLESMKDLLRRIEDAVPLISLALTTSGANLSSSLPDTVSPSRLLQASSLLRSADDAFESSRQPTQVGPSFIVKFYSIFTSHARVSNIKDIQWKEEYAKCRASIVRVSSQGHKEGGVDRSAKSESGFASSSDGYEYELRLTEDLNDGRYHEELENWSRKKMKSVIAEKGYIEGRLRHIPVHKIARLFYEHAGILLNLGESLSPVLIAKIQHGAPHPQSVLERFTNPADESDNDLGNGIASGFESEEEDIAPDLGSRMGDVEWVAFEVFQEDDEDNEEDDEEDEDSDATSDPVPTLSTLESEPSPIGSSPPLQIGILTLQHQHSSLSLLEYVLRLTALQTFEQQSHMSLTDEHIVLFLRDNNPASRQQPAFGQERASRRRSSQTSLSSDFSGRIHITGHQLPISPQSDDLDHVHGRTTPTSSSPIPSEKLAEKPANRNPRTHLERAMAQDYDPMTLATPIVKQRVTRSKLHQNSIITIPKRKSGAHSSNSAPNSSQKKISAPIGQNSDDVNDNNPLAGKAMSIPGRRAVSAAANVRRMRVSSRGD